MTETIACKDEYDKLIDMNKRNDLNDVMFQVHHIIPQSVGGPNTAENLVALSPRDHVRAHDLLFRYYMGCAKQMATALVSMLGSNGREFVSADQLPDSFDSDITEAYKAARKKTVCSLVDMSEKKIGYFDAVPAGYVERPVKDAERHWIRIFKPATRGVGRWVTGCAVPAGWKTKADLSSEELETVREYMGWETARQRAMETMERFEYAYSPYTLECKRFERGMIPEGWVSGMIRQPEKMLKERIGTERSCIVQCKDEATKARIRERLNVLLGMLERKAYDEALSNPYVSGIHEMDGRRMLLKNWAEEYGINLKTLRNRISRGWDLRRALTEKTGPAPGGGLCVRRKERRLCKRLF